MRSIEEVLCAKTVAGPSGCVLWQGRMWGGYGSFTRDGISIMAHRASYELSKGKIPAGLTLDHVCRNRACVNPDHLEPVTFRENVLRGTSFAAVNAKKTHCDKGHPLTGANLYMRPHGRGRQCRRCNADAAARLKARKAGAA